nr:YfhO family protein [Bacillus subtilis]
MTGDGDGISQMLPFKKLLYDEYVKGNFFYSYQFVQLAYQSTLNQVMSQ